VLPGHVGDFRVVALLAQGVAGHTLLVERDGRTHVAKRLVPRVRRDDDARSRLETEANILEALAGRGAPRLVARGEDASGPWFVMESIALPSLASLAPPDDGRARPGLVDIIASPSFEALAAVHGAADARGPLAIVHGDVSPSNLLVGESPPEARLVDFGLATWRDSPPPPPGPARGTAATLAPEVARGEPASVVSDLFSLGLTLAQVASGSTLRRGRSLPALLLEAGESSVLALAERACAGLAPAVRRALLATLAFEPTDRPPSARAALSLCLGTGS
jgi:serine/threonine-protein kinase